MIARDFYVRKEWIDIVFTELSFVSFEGGEGGVIIWSEAPPFNSIHRQQLFSFSMADYID